MSITRHEVAVWADGEARAARMEESTLRLTAAAQEAGRGAIMLANPRASAEHCGRRAACFEFVARVLREGAA